MQEEITQKTLALCVETGKMTAQLLQQAMKKVLADMEKHKNDPQLRHGKQTIRQLMFIVPDTQEAIVSQAQWDRVQELRKNKRRLAKAERQGLFSGLLYCADCGSKLHFATCKSFEGKQDHYVCSKYKSGRGDCSAHYMCRAPANAGTTCPPLSKAALRWLWPAATPVPSMAQPMETATAVTS